MIGLLRLWIVFLMIAPLLSRAQEVSHTFFSLPAADEPLLLSPAEGVLWQGGTPLGVLPGRKGEGVQAIAVAWQGRPEAGAMVKVWNREELLLQAFLEADAHYSDGSRSQTRLLFIPRTAFDRLEIRGSAGQAMQLQWYHTLLSVTAVQGGLQPQPCQQPVFEGRTDWCPTGECPKDATPQPTEVTHLIVHHSASPNTSADWAATVRLIYEFHVFGNGWDDIGYNWLIDPNGVLYEGRGEGLQGAHFCGTNSRTAGVCLLGTYTDTAPTLEARETLVRLLGWYSSVLDLVPSGEALHLSSGLILDRISGHRQGCATECPGEAFFQTFGQLRQEVQTYTDTLCPITSVVEASAFQAEVDLYPNPGEEQITVQLSGEPTGPVSYQILDLWGRRIQSGKVHKFGKEIRWEIDRNQSPPGLYQLVIGLKGQRKVLSFSWK